MDKRLMFCLMGSLLSTILQPVHAESSVAVRLTSVPDFVLTPLQSSRLDTLLMDDHAVEDIVEWQSLPTLKQGELVDLSIPSEHLMMMVTEHEIRGSTQQTWHLDNLSGEEYAILVQEGDEWAATLTLNSGTFQLLGLGGSTYALINAAPTATNNDCPPGKPVVDASYDPTPVSSNDSGSEIRLVVFYTPAAAGAVANINATIQLAVDETNTAYSNSRVTPRIVLAAKQQTQYAESSSMETDLTRFRTPNDGYMDEIHAVRDSQYADIAVLIGVRSDYCGLASDIMASPSTAFAFVALNCATGYYSFGHELGHLQGARHNAEVDGSTTPFAYGHGFCYPTGNWRTIMSYNSSCSARKQYFSNPTVLLNGVSTGTSSTNDVARVLNETASTVANFRTASVLASSRCGVTESHSSLPGGSSGSLLTSARMAVQGNCSSMSITEAAQKSNCVNGSAAFAYKSGWPDACVPEGLLSNLKAAYGSTWTQVRTASSDVKAAMNEVVKALSSSKSPVMVPLFGLKEHWIAVTKVQTAQYGVTGTSTTACSQGSLACIQQVWFYDAQKSGSIDSQYNSTLSGLIVQSGNTWAKSYVALSNVVMTSDPNYQKYVVLYNKTSATRVESSRPSLPGSSQRALELPFKGKVNVALTGAFREAEPSFTARLSQLVAGAELEVAAVDAHGASWTYSVIPLLERSNIVAMLQLEANGSFSQLQWLPNPIAAHQLDLAVLQSRARERLLPGERLGKPHWTWHPSISHAPHSTLPILLFPIEERPGEAIRVFMTAAPERIRG